MVVHWLITSCETFFLKNTKLLLLKSLLSCKILDIPLKSTFSTQASLVTGRSGFRRETGCTGSTTAVVGTSCQGGKFHFASACLVPEFSLFIAEVSLCVSNESEL